MTYEVRIGSLAAGKVAAAYGPERSVSGDPSEWDFWSGPLDAAQIKFKNFDSLPFDDHPSIRKLHTVDPMFGAIVFVGILTEPGVVEIADFAVDPDFWETIEGHPIEEQ